MMWQNETLSRPYRNTDIDDRFAMDFIGKNFPDVDIKLIHLHKSKKENEYAEIYFVHTVKLCHHISVVTLNAINMSLFWKINGEGNIPDRNNCPRYFFRFSAPENEEVILWRMACINNNNKLNLIYAKHQRAPVGPQGGNRVLQGLLRQ